MTDTPKRPGPQPGILSIAPYVPGRSDTPAGVKLVKLSANERVKKESALYVEADRSLAYDVVITAMAVAKRAGVTKVMMLTDPSEEIPVEDLDKPVPPR